MKKDTICFYRVVPIVLMVAAALFCSFLLCLINHLMLDESICIAFIDFIFLGVFIYELEAERSRYMLSKNRGTTFVFVMTGFLLCCSIMVLCSFLPDFCRPFFLFPLIMYTVSNVTLSIICAIFFQILFAITSSGNFYELIASVLLAVICCMIARGFDNKKTRVFSAILCGCTCLCTPLVFSYLSEGIINKIVLIVQAVFALVSMLFILFVYEKIRNRVQLEYEHKLEDILNEAYSLHHEFMTYYPADYKHACKVSLIAFQSAQALGYSPNLCSAAGLYYRIGKCLGEPYIENAVKKAGSLCFPVDLIQILAEYYGEEQLPSTPESALVYTVDALVFKVEALQKEFAGSGWNREMIIYQSMNEFSSKGLYDNCGMSMNQFLKLREYLVKEELWK